MKCTNRPIRIALQRTMLFVKVLIAIQCIGLGQGDTLQIAYTSAPPFIVNENDRLSGINIWLWEQIAQDLDIPYQLVELEFPEILERLKNGSVDASINPLTITAERSRSMIFTSPFYISNATAAMKKKGRWAYVNRFFSSLFSKEFLGGIILLIVIIGFFGLLTWSFERKHNNTDFRKGYKGLWDGLWWSAVTMTTVGYGDKSPKSFGGKIVALIWMFTALLFISGLTASIASRIIITNKNIGVFSTDNMRDLRLGTLANTSEEDYLRKRYYRFVSTFDSIEDGLKAVDEGTIDAYIYDEPILRYRLDEMNLPSIEITSLKFNLQMYAFAFQKNKSEIAQKVSERLLYHTNGQDWSVVLSEYDLSVM